MSSNDIKLLALTLRAQSRLVESGLSAIGPSPSQSGNDTVETLKSIFLELNELCRTADRLISNLQGPKDVSS